jgi:hypothetical protein
MRGKILEEYRQNPDIVEGLKRIYEIEERENMATKTKKGGAKKTVKDEKRMNRKQLCRDLLAQKKDSEAILKDLAATYENEGKDKEYSIARAKAILGAIKREKGKK